MGRSPQVSTSNWSGWPAETADVHVLTCVTPACAAGSAAFEWVTVMAWLPLETVMVTRHALTERSPTSLTELGLGLIFTETTGAETGALATGVASAPASGRSSIDTVRIKLFRKSHPFRKVVVGWGGRRTHGGLDESYRHGGSDTTKK